MSDLSKFLKAGDILQYRLNDAGDEADGRLPEHLLVRENLRNGLIKMTSSRTGQTYFMSIARELHGLVVPQGEEEEEDEGDEAAGAYKPGKIHYPGNPDLETEQTLLTLPPKNRPWETVRPPIASIVDVALQWGKESTSNRAKRGPNLRPSAIGVKGIDNLPGQTPWAVPVKFFPEGKVKALEKIRALNFPQSVIDVPIDPATRTFHYVLLNERHRQKAYDKHFYVWDHLLQPGAFVYKRSTSRDPWIPLGGYLGDGLFVKLRDRHTGVVKRNVFDSNIQLSIQKARHSFWDSVHLAVQTDPASLWYSDTEYLLALLGRVFDVEASARLAYLESRLREE